MAAGQQLRRRINAALRQSSRDAGADLVFTELETWLIDRVVELDRERLRRTPGARAACPLGLRGVRAPFV